MTVNKGNPPFFILGCVRSGTSFLRGILRLHPNLACPEETHFYRWPDPYGVPQQVQSLVRNETLKRHRALDRITEDEFQEMIQACGSRGQLMREYMQLFIQRRKPDARRWFDKTPQNVYGAAMIAAEFPEAKFVHIVRDPRAVIASLRAGRLIKVPELIGACNYWNEAIRIIDTLRRAYPERVHELRHEDLLDDLGGEITRLMRFLDEPFQLAQFATVEVLRRVYDYGRGFSDDDRRTIGALCGPLARKYRYALD